MKRYLIIAGCLGWMVWGMAAQGQNLVWAKQFGGPNNEIGKSIATDLNGQIYISGSFAGTTDFDPGSDTFSLSAISNLWDVFIAKLDASGNLLWAKQLGTHSSYSAMDIDDSGNVYVTGPFSGNVDFDPGSGIFNMNATNGGIYILKLNSTGNLVWAKQFGGSGSSSNAIAIDDMENVYVFGGFQSISDFDPGAGTLNLVPTGNLDAYISKLNASGDLVWAKRLGGTGSTIVRDAIVDDYGSLYLTGNFSGVTDFDPDSGTLNLSSVLFSYYDVFITKLNAAGNLEWAKDMGGGQNAEGLSIALDGLGNVYTTGSFSGFADFDPDTSSFVLMSTGTRNAFISKLDAAGNFIWAKQIKGASNQSQSIDADYWGNVYITGYFQSNADFDPNVGEFNRISAGADDLFVARLDASGILVWAVPLGGTSHENGNSLVIDSSGNIYLTGFFQSQTPVDYDPGLGTFNMASVGNGDVFILKLSPVGIFQITGNVFDDMNSDCARDTSEIALSGLLIKAEPGPFYGSSSLTGNYTIYLFDTASYVISVATQDTLWQPSCSTSYTIQATTFPDTMTGIDFAMRASFYCPRLTVELGTPRLRRCFNNTYSFTYRNTGTLPASNAYMEVDFGEYLQPQSSTLPWSSVSGNVYTFQLGNINIHQSGSFNVSALLDCNAQLGSTQCVTAHIYPDSVCAAPSTGWDKSETKVTGSCVNDSLVCFVIKNRSSPPSGNMQGTAPWRLYANDTLLTQGAYQLDGGDSLIQCYPANGKTYRLEADQRLGHPGNSRPQAIVEGCGSPTNFGFVNTVPQDDRDLFVETFCLEVIGSFDPNDKQVFPTGITSNRYIKEDTELEYLIRFQNTGTDTAFKVVIRDTLQTDVIDIATIVSGTSSHDYTFNIYGHGIAEWTFNNILLPDSNVNEPASHGFVQFKAKLLLDVAPGTLVNNAADIYFDFNAPIRTNDAWNTVFDTVLRAPVIISGKIITESNAPVEGVTVKLEGARNDSVVTVADGAYQFTVEPGGSYTVTPSKTADTAPSQGVTSLDILLMRKHLLDMGALPSPHKIIAAAEVNAEADTSVTTQDIVFTRSLILGNSATYPGSRLWQFVSSDHEFPDSSHPFPFMKSRSYENLFSPQLNQNFIGIKLGDVNGSWEE